MAKTLKCLAVCDANILIDYAKADEDIFRELCQYWDKVYVPDVVLNEVEELDAQRAVDLGLTIVETPLSDLESLPALSFQDSSCLFYVQHFSAVCLSNDIALRKTCIQRGYQAIWGLEMLLRLVSKGQIKAQRAKGLAEKIHLNNPEITHEILKEFIEKLSRIGGGNKK